LEPPANAAYYSFENQNQGGHQGNGSSRRTEPIDYALSGEVVLVTEAGEEILPAGDCVGARRSGNQRVS